MKISDETKVGVFATIAVVLLILGYNILKGNQIFSRNDIYYARYARIDNLQVPNRVRVNGMNVGTVQKLRLADDGSLNIIVSLAVDPAIKVPKGTVATIISADFLGTKAVELGFSKSSEYLKPGDTLLSAMQAGLPDMVRQELTPVKEKAEAVLVSMDSVLGIVKSVFNEQTKARLQHSIASIESTLGNLDKTSKSLSTAMSQQRLEQIFANIQSITDNLSQNSKQISNILANLSAISDTIAQSNIKETIAQAESSLREASEVMQKINDGKGSLGLLLNDDKLYNNLEKSAKSLDELLASFKANPSFFIHFSIFGGGKKTKPAPPPQPSTQ